MPPLRVGDSARAALIATSFFNLSLAPMWAAQKNVYVEPLPFARLFFMVLALGATLAVLAWVGRRWWHNRMVQALAFAAFLALPVSGLVEGLGLTAASLGADTGIGARRIRWIGSAAIPLLIAAVLWRGQWLVRGAATVLLILSPLLAHSAWLALSGSPPRGELGYAHHETPPASVAPPTRPVYLLLLDEADYPLIFERRPPGLQLPVFDKLAGTSAFFTQAYSAGRDTIISIPALLMGTPLKHVRADGRRLGAQPLSGEYRPDWLGADNLLTELAAQGLRVAVLGHYHAYCQHPRARFAYCSQWQYVLPFKGWAFDSLPFAMAAWQDHPLVARFNRRYLARAEADSRAAYERTFAAMSVELPRMIGTYDFVFAHLNHPHPAAFSAEVVRRRRPTITLVEYVQRLRETDALLDGFLEKLNASPHAGNAVVIVTSDHGLRCRSYVAMGYRVEDLDACTSADRLDVFRVPLMVHFAGTAHSQRLEGAVSTLDLKELVPRLMRGELDSVEAVAGYFAERPFDPRRLSQGQSFDTGAGDPTR